MKIIYENLVEFAEAIIKCEDDFTSGNCNMCPLSSMCFQNNVDDISERAVMQCEILPPVLVIKDNTEVEKLKKAMRGGEVKADEK